MIMRTNPQITTTEVFEGKDHLQNLKLKELNHFHLSILDHKNRYYKLEEVERYIEVKAVFTLFTYDKNNNNKKMKNEIEYPVIDCTKKDFDQNESTMQYY